MARASKLFFEFEDGARRLKKLGEVLIPEAENKVKTSQTFVKKGNIDLDEIEDFLKYSCLYYRHVQFDPKIEGQEVNPSEVSKIEN